MKKLLTFAEQGFTILSLVLYSGGPLTVILSNGANEGDLEAGSAGIDSSLILVCFLFNYLITCFLLLLRWKKVLYTLKKNRLIAALVIIAVFSIFWSYVPKMTISRGIAIVGTSLFGLYLASRYTVKQQLKLFAAMYGIAIIMSFIFIVALPKYGLMGGIHVGDWRGIYNHKNTLGKVISLGIIIFLILGFSSSKNRFIFWIGFLLSLILLLGSRSTSSLLNAVILVVAFFCYQVFRQRDEWMVFSLITIVSAMGSSFLLFLANQQIFFNVIGKDATLTGRTELWPYVLNMIWKNPWLGYGYGAFWYGESSPSFEIWQAVGWNPPNSHNGILDLWLQLGLLGLSVFMFEFLLITLPRSFIWVCVTKTPEELWPLLCMTYMVFVNLTESTLMVQNDLFWVFYVSIAFSVITVPKEKKLL